MSDKLVEQLSERIHRASTELPAEVANTPQKLTWKLE
jgi:hypothetical protein